jgi:hypothetical protein
VVAHIAPNRDEPVDTLTECVGVCFLLLLHDSGDGLSTFVILPLLVECPCVAMEIYVTIIKP